MSAFEKIQTKYHESDEGQKLTIVRDGLDLFRRVYGSDGRFQQHLKEAEIHLNENNHKGTLTYLAIIDIIANQRPVR